MFNHVLLTSSLFSLGLIGIIFNKLNLIIILMSIELILLSVNLNFIFFGICNDDISGQIFSLYVLAVAAAESAIGLAIIIVFYRVKGSIQIDFLNYLSK